MTGHSLLHHAARPTRRIPGPPCHGVTRAYDFVGACARRSCRCRRSPPTSSPDAGRLKSIEREAQQAAAERDKVKAETAGVARDLGAVRADMIATAKDIQDQEHSLTVMENRVADLEREAARMSASPGPPRRADARRSARARTPGAAAGRCAGAQSAGTRCRRAQRHSAARRPAAHQAIRSCPADRSRRALSLCGPRSTSRRKTPRRPPRRWCPNACASKAWSRRNPARQVTLASRGDDARPAARQDGAGGPGPARAVRQAGG